MPALEVARSVPSMPVAGEGEAARIVRREGRRRLALHARRLASVALGVLVVGAGVSVYLARVGTERCEATALGERCVETSWYALTLQPRTRIEKLNGVPDGERAEWYRNGELWFAGRYERGVKTGEWREHWPSGQMRFSGRYEAGRLEGVETWWYPTGTVEWQTHRKAGKRHGEETWYYPNGTRRRVGSYAEGERHGPFARFAPDGRLSQRGAYHHGVRTSDGEG